MDDNLNFNKLLLVLMIDVCTNFQGEKLLRNPPPKNNYKNGSESRNDAAKSRGARVVYSITMCHAAHTFISPVISALSTH